jgi:hypothetical protein
MSSKVRSRSWIDLVQQPRTQTNDLVHGAPDLEIWDENTS